MAEVTGHRGDDDGTSAALARVLLDTAVTHLVGQSRAYLLQLEAALAELEAARDPRTFRVVEALGMTLADPPRPGTVRHLETAATALLRSLRDLRDAIAPESPE